MDRQLDQSTLLRTVATFVTGAERLTNVVDDETVANALLGAWIEFASPRFGLPSTYEKLVTIKRDYAGMVENAGWIVPSDDEILTAGGK